MSYAKHISRKSTPQNTPIFGREKEMEKMASGGYAFSLDSMSRLRRFLILGSEGGSYYTSERDLTIQNAMAIIDAFDEHSFNAVDEIVRVSKQGLAPKNKPALFALAIAFSYSGVNKREVLVNAKVALPLVARTGSDLMYFVSQVTQLRGWGRGLRSAVAYWFHKMPADKLAYQAVKYKKRFAGERNGIDLWWSLRDALRLSHPKTLNEAKNSVYRYITNGKTDSIALPKIILASEKLKEDHYLKNVYDAESLIATFQIPREAVPTELLNKKEIWSALLRDMPLTAMVRNLGKMTSIGVLEVFSKEARDVVVKLSDIEYLHKSRLHPFTILTALNQYAKGVGNKGDLKWSPVLPILNALNDAFFASFKNVSPTGRRILVGVDVSGSMGANMVSGMSDVTAAQAAATLAMVIANTEEQYHIIGFHTAVVPNLPNLTGNTSLEQVLNQWEKGLIGGLTDCAVPIIYALERKIATDAFVIITDEESWYGNMHVTQVFNQYKNTVNPDAKLVIIGTTSSGTTIADPRDKAQLNLSGFDASAFEVMNTFIRGDV